jgi:hypothetical protein
MKVVLAILISTPHLPIGMGFLLGGSVSPEKMVTQSSAPCRCRERVIEISLLFWIECAVHK